MIAYTSLSIPKFLICLQEVVYQKSVASPYEDNYNMLAGVGIESWSRCGGSTAILNVNSEIRITPATSPNVGFMTVSGTVKMPGAEPQCSRAHILQQVDSFDGNVHVVFAAKWRSC
jgi:hypothetical protein